MGFRSGNTKTVSFRVGGMGAGEEDTVEAMTIALVPNSVTSKN